MKTKIIPSINAQSFEEIKEKIEILKNLTNHFHLDIASKDFTGYDTWKNYNDLPRINTDIPRMDTNNSLSSQKFAVDDNVCISSREGSQKFAVENNVRKNSQLIFDLHLMTFLKPQEILKWAKENVKRLILHLEASQNPDGFLKFAKKTRKKVFIVWSPDIEFEFIEKYLNFVNGIMILGVNPGRAGQSFLEETYQRIEFIRSKLKKNQKLMIDGGINKENFKKILNYKPDYIVMASAIYNNSDPRKSYLEFLKDADLHG